MAHLKTDIVLLKAQAKQLEMHLDIKNRKYHLKTYKKCFIGKEAILPIINLGFATSESSAVEFGNKLLKAKIIAHVENQHNFKNDSLFYKFTMDLTDANDLDALKLHRQKTAQLNDFEESNMERSTSAGSVNSVKIEILSIHYGVHLIYFRAYIVIYTANKRIIRVGSANEPDGIWQHRFKNNKQSESNAL